MLNRRTLMLAALAATSIFIASTSAAHEAARVETNVAFGQANVLNVTHVLQLSAAQRLLHKAGLIETNDMTGLRARAQAALYSSKRFELKADGQTLPLEILGAEVQGGHLYIYQTGTLSALPKSWSARNSILRDLSPRFDNMVNVPTENGIRTIVFSGSDLESFNSPD